MKDRTRHYFEDLQKRKLKEVLKLMQDSIVDPGNTWFGVPAQKFPPDAWVYQQLIVQMKPDVIVEIGNASGGSTLFLAHMLDLVGHGRVIGIDISHRQVPDIVKNHPRICLVEGDASLVKEKVIGLIRQEDQVMVIEDSSHTFGNTLAVLRLYSPLIKPGGYFIVEDTICHHGLDAGPDPGPFEAVEAFLKENPGFEPDRNLERFFITWNPKGFLKKVPL